MKSSLFFATTLVASAFAQSSSETLAVSSSPSASSISTSTLSIDNPLTTFLTQTNSLGVITGQPAVVTSQPAVATIPALGTGTYTIAIGNTTNIVVTVGPSTTAIISGDAFITTSGSSVYVAANNTASGSGASLTGSDASATGSSTSKETGKSASKSASGASSSSTNAAANIKAASGALLGAGAMFAAFL